LAKLRAIWNLKSEPLSSGNLDPVDGDWRHEPLTGNGPLASLGPEVLCQVRSLFGLYRFVSDSLLLALLLLSLVKRVSRACTEASVDD